MSLYYLFKYEEHTEFLFPIAIVTVLETIFCISGLPEILGKISLFTYVDTIKCSMAVNLANVFIMFYMMANINKELFKTKHAMRITILVTCLLVFVKFPTDFSSRGYLFIYIIELCSTIFLFLNFEDKKYKKVLLSLLVIFVLCGGITVNPILKDRTAPLIRPVQEILPQ